MAEQQKQHGGSPWYPGGAQYQYPPTQQFYPQQQQQKQQHQHQQQQQQQHPPPWANTPPLDQPFPYHQAQGYHHQQMGYYPPHPHPQQQQQQQQQHYPPQPMPPPQPLPNPPTQFSYMYGPQDQAWPGGNSMRGYPQLIHPGGNAQDWEEKARAWATAKVAMDSNQPPQSAIPHLYQHYQQPDSQVVHHADRLQYSVSSTGQDAATAMAHENGANPVPKQPFNSSEQPMHATSASDSAFNGSGPKGALAPLQVQSSIPQVVSSSFLHDIAPSYGQANSLSDPRGIEKKEGTQLHLPLQQSPSAGFSLQQQLQFISSAPNDSQQQSFGYSDQLLPSAKEYQKMEFPSHQNFQHQPQYRSSIPPPAPPSSSSAVEVSEPEFGMPSTANPNWTSAGVSNLVYSAQVAGGPQFEPLHPSPMHLPPVSQSSMFGRPQLPQQSLTFPSAGPAIGGPYAIGGSPGLGPVSGPSIFIPDSNGNTGYPERPKKAAVPSWLRELLLKKRAEELSNNASGVMMGEGSISPKSGMTRRLQDNSPGSSDNDDDEREAEIEAAREAAINQEIKRILTEVLLKVTGDLFNEIAEEVVEEDDIDSSPGRRVVTEEHAKRMEVRSPSPPPPPPPVPTAPARVLLSSTPKRRSPEIKDGSESEGNDSAVGNVLGLANYGSDGEDEDARAMNARASSVNEEEAMNDIDGNNEITEDTEKLQGELKEAKTNGDKEGWQGKDKPCPTPPPSEQLLGNKGFERGTQNQAEESKSQLIDKMTSSPNRYEKKDIPTVDMKEEESLAPHSVEDTVNERERNHGKDKPSQSLVGGREEPSNRRGDRTKDERGNKHGKEVGDPRKDALNYGKERKREDRGSDINKKKVSDDRDRESREKHRVKSRDKTKEREREPERHHRGDKEMRERKGREKRMEPHEMRRNRHRSSSVSSRGRSASRSRSLSSPETRRKHHPRRASRNRSASLSPGISKRRRVSTSRSPPTKHSSRRKSPSPSNEKPRYKRSRSRSPRSHRRKRS